MICPHCGTDFCNCRQENTDEHFRREEKEYSYKEDAAAEAREKREQHERDRKAWLKEPFYTEDNEL